jgi:hypothetical protein
MAIDISGISNPVTSESAYDPNNPGKWVDELSIFYLRIFKEVQVSHSGILEDFSSLSFDTEGIEEKLEDSNTTLSALENTLSGRKEEGEEDMTEFFGTMSSFTASLYDEVETIDPSTFSLLPDLVKVGLPAISGPIGWVVKVVYFLWQFRIIDIVLELLKRRGGTSGNEKIIEAIEAQTALLEESLIDIVGENRVKILEKLVNSPLHIHLTHGGEVQDVMFDGEVG